MTARRLSRYRCVALNPCRRRLPNDRNRNLGIGQTRRSHVAQSNPHRSLLAVRDPRRLRSRAGPRIHPGQRPENPGARRPSRAGGGLAGLVQGRLQLRTQQPDRYLPPAGTYDVQGHADGAGRRVLPPDRRQRRRRERLYQSRLHGLFPDAGKGTAGTQLPAGSRPDAPPAAQAGGREQGSSGGDRGAPAAHRRPTRVADQRAVQRRRLPHQPLPPPHHRLDAGHPGSLLGRSQALVPAMVCAEQRHPGGGRRCGPDPGSRFGPKTLRAATTQRVDSTQAGGRTTATRRAPDRGQNPGRSALRPARLQGTDPENRH